MLLFLPRKRTGDARELPPARTISNMMGESDGRRDSENSLLLMQMGQFVDHDITHTPNYADQKCCTKIGRFPRSFDAEKCFPLRLPKKDPFWRGSTTCMEFSRSLASPGLACELQHREQLNQVPVSIRHNPFKSVSICFSIRLSGPALYIRAGDPLAGRLQHLRLDE
jgi:peroxidase